MGRKTTTTSLSANRSQVSSSNSSSNSTQSNPIQKAKLTPNPKSLTPEPSSLPGASTSHPHQLDESNARAPIPVKRPRSATASSSSKRQRASLPGNETSLSGSSRKRPSSSNSDYVDKLPKQESPEVSDSNNEGLPSSGSKQYNLRSRRSSSSMKRASNGGQDSQPSNTAGSRTSSTGAPIKPASTPLQASNTSEPKTEKPEKQSTSKSTSSTAGIFASLVGSADQKPPAESSKAQSKQQQQNPTKAAASSSKSGASSLKAPSSKASSSNPQSNAASSSNRRGHQSGSKSLSSGKVASPRDSGRSKHQGGASSSNNANMSELAASFASAAAAMNSISSNTGASSSTSGGAGIPTLPAGSNDGASGSGAASLLRQFGKFLSRGGSNSGPTSARAMGLINQLQTAAFDTEQLQCLQDLCDIINMNTEDTLQEFPSRQAATVLTELMSGAAGFEVAIAACRCLTYMLDCVPHAAKFVKIDTVRCLISKLNDIECIDIAEQALSALELLSASHHSKLVLRAGGVAACLQFIDFFSTLCQQKSLAIVTNCCLGLTAPDFSHIRDSVDRLAQQLLNSDRKCAELVSLAFSYIVAGCDRDESILREVASRGFLINAQQVLQTTPPVVSPAVFCQLFSTMSAICRHCPDQSVQLLLQNFPSTVAFLLTGNREALNYTNEKPTVLLSSGNTPNGICSGSQELQEIVTLISELLPPQPDEELFTSFPKVPSANSSGGNNGNLSAASQYMSTFLQSPFEWTENPFSFLAFNSGDDNDGDADPTEQAIRAMQNAISSRNQSQNAQPGPPAVNVAKSSSNTVLADLYAEKPQMFHGLVANLTGPLLDICQTTTAGTIELKAKCLETLQRLLIVAPDSVLDAMIRAADLSSCLAQFLTARNSSDLRVAGLAIQICHLLLRRQPELFASQAVKQGISHQISQTLAYVNSQLELKQENDQDPSTPKTERTETNSRPETGEVVAEPSLETGGEESQEAPALQQSNKRSTSRLSGGKTSASKTTPKSSAAEPSTSNSRAVRSSSRGSGGASNIQQQQSSSDNLNSSLNEDDSSMSSGFRKLRSTMKSVLSRGKATVGAQQSQTASSSQPSTSSRGQSGRKSDGSPNLQGSSRSRGNRQPGSSVQSRYHNLLSMGGSGASSSQPSANELAMNSFYNAVKQWIAQWAKTFLDKLDEIICKKEENSKMAGGISSNHAALKVAALTLLQSSPAEAEPSLIEIRDLVMTRDFSLFELGSSGLSESIGRFLSLAGAAQLRLFLRLFAVLPPGLETHRKDGVRLPESFQHQPLAEFVTKIVGCLQQIEQFEVKSATVRDRAQSSIFGAGMPSSLLAAAMTSSGAGANQSGAAAFSISPVVRFFSTSSLKLELRRNQQASAPQSPQKNQSGASNSSRLPQQPVPSCLVRIDPLLTVDVLSRWIVQKGLHLSSGPLSMFGSGGGQRGQRSQSNVLESSGADTSSVSGGEDFDDGDSSIADFSSTMTDDGGMSSGPESSLANAEGASSGNPSGTGPSSNSASVRGESSSNRSASGVQVELLIEDTVIPPEITLYQAVAQYALGLSDEAMFSLSSSEPLFTTPHAINFRVRTQNQTATSETEEASKMELDKPSTSPVSDSDLPSIGILDEFLRKSAASSLPPESPVNQHLSLLRQLYGLNRYWYSLFDAKAINDEDGHFWFPNAPVKPLMAVEEFISPKLNLKAQRQLRDTFVLATGIVPKWLQAICQNWPFLLSYDVRLQIFYLTTFGRDRGILRLNHLSNQNANAAQQSSTASTGQTGSATASGGAFSGSASLSASDQAVQSWLARIVRSVEKRRYEVQRSQLLADAMRVLKQSSSPAFRSSIVEIQYKNEVGVGLGPTLEFYALVSRHLRSPELDLWHAMGNCSSQPGAFLYPKSHNASSASRSLSPQAKEHGGQVELFRFLGQFVARAIVDGRMVDLNFNPLFIDRMLLAQHQHGLFNPLPTDLLWVDRTLARSVAQLVQISRHDSHEVVNGHLDDLMLDFTVPGRHDVDLSGDDPSHRGPLTAHNLEAYITKLLDFFLSEGIQDFLTAFCDGFNSVFPIDSLRKFFCSPSEIEAFLNGTNDSAPWDPQQLREAIRPDHGYNQDSPVVHWLIETLITLDYTQRRLFLQFATGTPRLPLGGFAALSPPLTVVRRALEQSANPDDFLPSVMTCANYLKMPEYSSKDILRRKLLLAITDGQETFHLS